MEKALYNRLSEYINNNNLLIGQQFNFRKTEDAIFKLLHEVLNALSNGTEVCGIFCDLEKALDCVNHSLLIKKTSILWNNGKI
jgi:hypothetical protein